MEDHIDRVSFTEMAVNEISVGMRHRKGVGDIGCWPVDSAAWAAATYHGHA
jgi:hypothetical protein